MSIVKLPFVTLESKGAIVYLNFNKAVIIDDKQLRELIDIRNKLANYKPHLVLTVFNAVVDFTDEARKMAALEENTSTSIAHAVIVKRLGQRLVTAAYKQVDKPHYPLEVFTDEDKAVDWLLTHLPESDRLHQN
jgi:hypothetical protein